MTTPTGIGGPANAVPAPTQAAALNRILEAQRDLLTTPLDQTQRPLVAAIGEIAAALGRLLGAPAAEVAALPTQPVLLVEDGEANRLLATTILTKAGYRVETAVDGHEAVTAAAHRDYCLVLMDLGLPRMDGLTAALAIRALPGRRGQVPILAMTARDRTEDLNACCAAGMAGLVAKPFVAADLLAELSRRLGPGTQGAQAGEVPPQEGAPLLDRRALEDLEADIPPDFMPRLLNTFMAEAGRRAAAIAAAAAVGDFAAVGLEAHALKGSAATFGAMPLRAAALALEQDARAGLADLLVTRAAELSELAEASVLALARHFELEPPGRPLTGASPLSAA